VEVFSNPMSKQAFDAKIAALEALRATPEAALDPLRRTLKDRSNFLVAKAAALAGDLSLSDLIPDLLAAFDRALDNGAKTDSQCWAKNAIAKALKDLSHHDAEVYLKGLAYVQKEPVWGGQVDTAAVLRGTCAMALVDCQLDDLSMLNYLAEALADPEKTVRVDAAVALSRAGIAEAVPLLRLKALSGDPEAEVTGQCLYSLLQMSPRDSVAFAKRFLSHHHPDDVRAEAASALAQSHEPAALEALTHLWRTVLSPELRKALLAFFAASPQRAAAEFLFNLDSAEARAALESSRYRDEFRPR
jgi:HEAT repeat protein